MCGQLRALHTSCTSCAHACVSGSGDRECRHRWCTPVACRRTSGCRCVVTSRLTWPRRSPERSSQPWRLRSGGWPQPQSGGLQVPSALQSAREWPPPPPVLLKQNEAVSASTVVCLACCSQDASSDDDSTQDMHTQTQHAGGPLNGSTSTAAAAPGAAAGAPAQPADACIDDEVSKKRPSICPVLFACTQCQG